MYILMLTFIDVAKKYNISDTSVRYIFQQYLDIQRLPLPEILSVDEVYLDIDYKHKYALILMDFMTGELVDILPNRWEETTHPYFLSIPIQERRNVKYLICDMYNPYINYTKRYFPKSVALIDSFHVIAWLNTKIIVYINEVKKRFQERDKKEFEEKNKNKNRKETSIPVSDEVYLLNNFRWLLLSSVENINYSIETKYNHKLKRYLNTYDYEKLFFELDIHFKNIRKEKEKYIEFNSSVEKDYEKVSISLNVLIDEYSKCSLPIFNEFAKTLKLHKQEIVNSFTYVTDKTGKSRRLSNGPIEGYNRVPKDLKRNARGLGDFTYTRCRLIWANRKNEPILSIPKSKEEVYKFKNRKNK